MSRVCHCKFVEGRCHKRRELMKRNESVDSWIFVVGCSYRVLLDSLSHWRAIDRFQAVAFHEQICVLGEKNIALLICTVDLSEHRSLKEKS